MELKLLDLYPLKLEIDNKIVTLASAHEHLSYINSYTLPHGHYDKPFENNSTLREWDKAKKTVNKNSAIYRRQIDITSSNIAEIDMEVDKEFCDINTTLSVGQILFRDTKREEIPVASSAFYMATSIIPGAYLAGREYDTTLMLTIKSVGVKCHYYGDSESACEWEVLLQKGLTLTKTNEYIIPDILRFGEECISERRRTIMEFDITTY